MAEPLRYGIIGTGMMGCEHILNLVAIDDAEVIAYSDPHPTSREWAAACLGEGAAATGYVEHRELIARDDLDAVVIATPNYTHLDVLRDVLATDLHVMVEKPLCTTVADCLEVRRLAADRDPIVWVGLEYRYMPTISRFLTLLDRIGPLRMISIREHRFPFLPKVGDWNRFTDLTGGTLVEKCCHFFDLMNLVTASRPVRVLASGGQDVNHLDEVYDGRRADMVDNAYVIVEFDSGARGMLDLCMFAEGGRFEQEVCAVGDHAKLETTVPGDTVWLGPRDRSGVVAEPAPLPPTVTYEGFHHGSSFREHLEFIAAIRDGRPPTVGVEDGLWSVAVGAAAHRSIDQRRAVEVAELFDEVA